MVDRVARENILVLAASTSTLAIVCRDDFGSNLAGGDIIGDVIRVINDVNDIVIIDSCGVVGGTYLSTCLD